jgi:hypothetical protein
MKGRWVGLLLLTALAGCGIKGEPSPPEPAAEAAGTGN